MEQTSTTNTNLLRDLSNQMADAVARVTPALVLVDGRQRQPASGIIYTQDLVLTADHVLEREENVTVQTIDKRTLPARLVGRDRTSDLAVLRVAGLNQAVPVSQEVARVGQLVMAVGYAPNEGPMASSGVVSTIGGPLRAGNGAVLERYIRTDAIAYPGFSGGPLIDMQGAVVGVLTTGLVNNVALAIPMNIARNIADTLVKEGYIKRGYLGISSQFVQLPLTQRAGLSQDHGLLIVKVDDNTPAQKGGILVGDILVALDGHDIRDSEDLQLLLSGERVGKTIPVSVIRGNAIQTLQVTIGHRQ